MSDTADNQPATDTPPMASITGPATGKPLLTPHLTTDSDAPSTKRASRKDKPLSLRQSAYVANLTDPGSPTYGNKLQSAIKAGYSPEHAYSITEIPAVANEITKHLESINAGSKVRTGILASLMHKPTTTAEQYSAGEDGKLRLVSRTVSDNDKVQLQAIKELGKLDGSYHRAALTAHAQRKVLDPVLAAWGRRLRASLAPQQQAGAGDKQAIDVDSVVVEHADQGTDALEGQGESMAGSPGEGTEADGGEGGMGGGSE